MRKLIAGIVIAAALLGLAARDAIQSKANVNGVARFSEVETAHSSLGVFASSTESWRVRVVDVNTGKVYGHGIMACIRITASKDERQCFGTYDLPQGVINVAGIINTRANIALQITATDGYYAQFHGGKMTAIQISSNPRTAALTFYLLS